MVRTEGGHVDGSWCDRAGCQAQGELEADDQLWRALKGEAERSRSGLKIAEIKNDLVAYTEELSQTLSTT